MKKFIISLALVLSGCQLWHADPQLVKDIEDVERDVTEDLIGKPDGAVIK